MININWFLKEEIYRKSSFKNLKGLEVNMIDHVDWYLIIKSFKNKLFFLKYKIIYEFTLLFLQQTYFSFPFELIIRFSTCYFHFKRKEIFHLSLIKYTKI